MFRTLGRTLGITETSWRVLRSDGLMLFPLAMGFSFLLVLVYVLVAFEYGGTFDRVRDGFDVLLADFILLGLAYFGACFAIVYFNAALVSAVHYRIMGGTPDFRYGLEAANDRLGALAVWCVLGATIGLVTRPLAHGRGVIGNAGRFVADVIGGWAPSLVLPVMMAEGSAPAPAMQRASEMFTETWHRDAASNQGFGLPFAALLLATAALGGALCLLGASLGLAILAAMVAFAFGFAFLKCLETLFLVALYNYAAVGETDGYFDEDWLQGAYGHANPVARRSGRASGRRAAA